LAEAAYRLDGSIGPSQAGAEAPPELIDDADTLAGRLRDRRPAFFDAAGDRRGGRGEYVVALRPEIVDTGGGAQVSATATLEVWTRGETGVRGQESGVSRANPAPAWTLKRRLVIDHGRSHRSAP
jgi:hypothetical protein